jgi:hypothetical protein
MTQYFCPYCDKSLTRQARLALKLQKLGLELHRVKSHFGEFKDCKQEPCAGIINVIEEREEQHAAGASGTNRKLG